MAQVSWRLWLLVRRPASGFTDAGGTRLAAAIAYYALLSLFPLVIVLVAGASLLPPEEGARGRSLDAAAASLPQSEAGPEGLLGVLETATAGSGRRGAVGRPGPL